MQTLYRSSFVSALIGACVLVAQPAFSEDTDVYSRTGLYLGASILGSSYLTITDQLSKTLGDDLESDPTLGFDIYAGYRVHRFVALEAEFEMLPSSDIDLDREGTLAELETITGTLNAKIFAPLGRFQPFIKAGVGVANVDQKPAQEIEVKNSGTDVIGRFGGGADFYITKNVVAHFMVEYTLPGGHLDNYDYISYGTGLQYRF
jgi:opacity protein-like surface antigen